MKLIASIKKKLSEWFGQSESNTDWCLVAPYGMYFELYRGDGYYLGAYTTKSAAVLAAKDMGLKVFDD